MNQEFFQITFFLNQNNPLPLANYNLGRAAKTQNIMHFITKLGLTLLLLIYHFTATAQNEADWSGITGTCGTAQTGTFGWPNNVPDHSFWSNPDAFDPTITGEVISKSFEIPNGKTLEIVGDVWQFFSQDYATTPTTKVRIKVRKGGHLIINGATLTRCGTHFWDGIEVEGSSSDPQGSAYQGKVTLKNNAMLEFAYETLSMGNGGILHAEGSSIRNFRRAAEFLLNDHQSSSYFQDMEIYADNDYPVRTNSLCDGGDKLHTAMITIYQNNGIYFTNCSFRNDNDQVIVYHADMVGGAISALNSDVYVDAVDYNYFGDCLVGSGYGCVFKNLAFGIMSKKASSYNEEVLLDVRAELIGSPSPNNVNLTGGNDYHYFANCGIGVVAYNLDQVRVSGTLMDFDDGFQQWCQVISTDWCVEEPDMNSPNIEIRGDGHRIGVLMDGVPRHMIGSNLIRHDVTLITDAFTGIIIMNSGSIQAIPQGTVTKLNWHRALLYDNQITFTAGSAPWMCNAYIEGIDLIGDNRKEEIICNNFYLDDAKKHACGYAVDIIMHKGVNNFNLTLPASINNNGGSADNRFSDFDITGQPTWYQHNNMEVDGGSINYYHQSNGYDYEPVHRSNVNCSLVTSNDCPSFDLCFEMGIPGDNDGPPSNKRETDREKGIRLYNYMYAIERSVARFDKDSFNYYMPLLEKDTGFQFTYSSHFNAYNVLTRCMNYGKHNLDITDYEYKQLDSIAHSPKTNASAWAK
ncbi:MAG: hypothetical protein KDC92_09905, partial [Bacteroidetes bacterium]|nr:hypothetical protein [Bacteroidota bacterium]